MRAKEMRIKRASKYDVGIVLSVMHCCFRVTDLLEYSPEELTGKNLYNLCHGEDADKLRKSHLDCKCGLLANGDSIC